MVTIKKAGIGDISVMMDIGARTILESHGHSAPKADMDMYVKEKFSREMIEKELSDPANIYHLIYSDAVPAGYSKIILNASHPEIEKKNVTKMERIYLLKEFYGSDMGKQLFNFNLELSKNNSQQGMWLHVWVENERAFRFYIKNGFKPIGKYDFKVSPTHSNPNHLMYLEY